MWTKSVLDCTGGIDPPVFYPVECDDNGHITSIVLGVAYIGTPPAGTRVVGAFHEWGQEKMDEIYKENGNEIEALIEAANRLRS